ncbi:MAG: helix-turn-helix domain-containing protein [Legionellaceae bacterium]|nr:helix-turn-helix domain-containing protein [Legionellaceae bacterium]
MGFSHYIPVLNAAVLLLDPLLEIVIHDLESGNICFIEGKLSNRCVGDASLLNREELENDLSHITYPKLNFDGRLIKSISVPVDDAFLICMNCDISIFKQIQKFSELFTMSHEPSMPNSLFRQDWQEKLHVVIHTYLNEKAWNFDGLTQKQKKDVVHYLFQQGAFVEKNAADYIANVLKMGRATIFNYLKSWRKIE